MVANGKGLYLTPTIITATILDDKTTSTTFKNQLIKRTINIERGFEMDTHSNCTFSRLMASPLETVSWTLEFEFFKKKVIHSFAGSCEEHKHWNTDKTRERAGHISWWHTVSIQPSQHRKASSRCTIHQRAANAAILRLGLGTRGILTTSQWAKEVVLNAIKFRGLCERKRGGSLEEGIECVFEGILCLHEHQYRASHFAENQKQRQHQYS